MDKKLYDLMDWAGIEEIVYSEAADPHKLLGPHVTDDGLLISAFIPTAVMVTVRLASSGKEFPMELADEAGFFSALIPRKNIPEYTLLVVYDNGTTEELHDPYAFSPLYTESDLKKFEAGVHYTIYEKMGAHPANINGVAGVYFSVWAPCAMRVSVVGDFNLWDGRRHQMRRLGDSGIFELFIPGLASGLIYKYEIKNSHGDPQLKADPYGNFCELRPNTASAVTSGRMARGWNSVRRRILKIRPCLSMRFISDRGSGKRQSGMRTGMISLVPSFITTVRLQ